ncbi:collagen alpha-1(XII) chain-like [Saccostrea echinata]|uniref:collagen alpha-1(XII) chain-like n=1 Tax=Saccostrea echinata TaxID=191078 RepID=UPI002A817DB6|nr:collagen alpha-1(XII) chain-like [Saccostrea echinata]
MDEEVRQFKMNYIPGNTDSQFIFNLAESSSTDCSQDADIAFLIDTSRSLGLQAYKKELHFVERVLERYEIGTNKTKVAVITFSAGSKLEFDFNRYNRKDEVLRAIRSIPYTDGLCTTIYRALKQAREEVFVPQAGDRENFKNLAVILTDGETNPGRYDLYTLPKAKSLTRQEANDLKFHGVEVFGIGVGHRVDHVEMIGISSGARNYYRVDDIDDLEKSRLFHILLNKVCARCNNKPADIFFIVDKSSSLGSVANFDKELSFIARFVEGFNIGQGTQDVRVGVISFSTDAQLEFGLSAYGDKRSLQDALLDIKFSLGNTYTHKAFEILLNQGFSASPRPLTVPRVGVIMTDGQSTNPYKLDDVLKLVKLRGIEIFSIGFGSVDIPELNKMATVPDHTHVFVVDDIHTLDTVRDELYLEICNLIGQS